MDLANMESMECRPIPSHHLLFDLDGTLIDSAVFASAIIDDMLAERGAADRADPALVRSLDNAGGEAMIAAVIGRHCRSPEIELSEFRARMASMELPPGLPFPGVRAGLKRLHEAVFVMAICSNKPQSLCERLASGLGLAQWFEAIIGSHPDRPRKPSPDPLLHAMTAFATSPQHCIYIGDSAIHSKACAAARVPCLIAGWGYDVARAQA